MHIGTPSKDSKTKCVFFCPAGHFKPYSLPPSTPPTDPSQLPVTSKPKQESAKHNHKRHDTLYNAAPETALINIREHGHITFTKHFKYLGSYCSYSLKDNYNIAERLSQASSAMGLINHFWADSAVDNFGKYLIFRAIPCNLLLWGCKSWAIREAKMKKLEVFIYRNIIKPLKIDIAQVIDERTTNISICERFFDIATICNDIAHQQLTFIGNVVRNPDDQIFTQLITAWCNHKKSPGGVFQNNKKNLAQNICLFVPGATKDGLLTTWMYFALDNSYWK